MIGRVLILIAPGEHRWDAPLQVLDALILTGGGDIDPDRYRGRRHETNYGIDAERDAFESAATADFRRDRGERTKELVTSW